MAVLILFFLTTVRRCDNRSCNHSNCDTRNRDPHILAVPGLHRRTFRALLSAICVLAAISILTAVSALAVISILTAVSALAVISTLTIR